MAAAGDGEPIMSITTWLRALCLGATLMTAGLAGAAQAPLPVALRQLEPGDWELRAREDGTIRHLCVADLQQLLQIQHPRSSCKRYLIRDTPETVVVTYDCAGAGNGRTDLRVETPRLVQIRSQGIVGGLPFVVAFEGRRIGACS